MGQKNLPDIPNMKQKPLKVKEKSPPNRINHPAQPTTLDKSSQTQHMTATLPRHNLFMLALPTKHAVPPSISQNDAAHHAARITQPS
jgi:hypothetical protein